MKVLNLSMFCITIGNTTEGKIGLLRIYKNPGKNMFGIGCRWLVKFLAKLVKQAITDYETAIGDNTERTLQTLNTTNTQLLNSITLEETAYNTLIDMLNYQNEKQTCERFILSLIPKADNVLLIPHRDVGVSYGSTLVRVSKEMNVKEFNKDGKQTLCIPVEDNAGIVQIERFTKGKKLEEEIGNEAIEVIRDIAMVALNRMKMNKEFNENQVKFKDEIKIQKRICGVTLLFGVLEKNYKSNIRAGLHLICSRLIFKYPNLRVNIH
jgi:hypothetical protein